MELFGFTIIRTKELDDRLQQNERLLSIMKEVAAPYHKTEEERDIELRKWCVIQGGVPIGTSTEIIYRYVKTGDASILRDYKEFCEWLRENKKGRGNNK